MWGMCRWDKPVLGLIDLDELLLRKDGSGMVDQRKASQWEFDTFRSVKFDTQFRGRNNNLISIDDGHGRAAALTVQRDDHDPNPQWRYKMLYHCRGGGVCLAASPDGLSFESWNHGKPVTGRAADTYNTLYYDQPNKRYMLNSRKDFATESGWRDIRGHRVLENKNLHTNCTDWRTVKEWYLDASGKVEKDNHHLYSLAVTVEPGVYLGVVGVLQWPRDLGDGGIDPVGMRPERDVSEVHLATSRDGVHWDLRWIYRAKPLIERGPAGAWDKGSMTPATTILRAHGKQWLFFAASNERHHNAGVGRVYNAALKQDNFSLAQNSTALKTINQVQSNIGVAAIVEGRMIGAIPLRVEAPSRLLTHGFELQGDVVYVNCVVRGRLQVKVCNADVEEGSCQGTLLLARSVAFSQRDGTKLLLIWEGCRGTAMGVGNACEANEVSGATSLGVELIGRHVRLEFVFSDAEIFGFQIGRSEQLNRHDTSN